MPSALARQTVTVASDPYWLACKWERYTATRLPYGSRVTEPRGRRVKPKYLKTFIRLAKHLQATDLSPDAYFTLLLDRISDKRRAPLILRVPLLGTRFYNQLVSEQRLRRKQQFAGREDRETLSYRTIPTAEPGYAPASLARDVARLTLYRRQYHWFEWGRFWLFFGSEFSGAFLSVTPEYCENTGDPLVSLSQVQLTDWHALERDDRLAAQVRETVRVFRRRVRTLPCIQQMAGSPAMEQVVTELLRPRLTQHSIH